MRCNHLPSQFRWLFALSLILPLLASPQGSTALAQPLALSSSPHTAQQIDLVDQIGGQPQAIYVSGSIAYVVMGSRLFVLGMDINTGFISQIYGTLLSPLLVNIKSIYAAGDYVYLTSSTYGLLIVNMISPGSPALIGQLSLPGQANDVVVQGSYAFIADGTAGIHTVNISQPAQPVLVNTLPPDAGDSAFALVAIGNYLYVANYNHLLVVNKSNPAQLTKFTSWTLLGTTDIANVPGETKIFLSSSSGLQELTTANGVLSNFRFQPAADGSKLAANSSYIYLLKPGQPGHDVQTVRRSDLLLLTPTSFTGTAVDLATDRGNSANNNVYKLNSDSGMKIYSTQPNGSLQYTTHALLSDLPSAQGMDLYRTNLNVAAGNNGLVTIDTTNPEKPLDAINYVNVSVPVSNVATTVPYAYLAAGTNGVRVVSTAAGSDVGGYTLTGMDVTDLALHSHTVNFSSVTDIYMGTYKGVVAVTVMTPPATFSGLSALTTPPINEIQIPPTRLGATTVYAYIATNTDFKILQIIDPVLTPLPKPAEIKPLDAYSSGTNAVLGFDIQTSSLKTYAYLCFDGGVGMDILDISDPMNISQLGHYPMSCRDVDVIGDRAFVLSTDQVSVLDISNRSDPKRIGFYTLNGIAEDILAYKPANTPYTYIYASDTLYGVWVLRFSEHAYLPVVMRH